jgi:hypothetical protein
MTTGTPPRDAQGRPQSFIDPASAPENAGRWVAYRADPRGGWVYAGIYDSEADARAAVGLPPASHETES